MCNNEVAKANDILTNENNKSICNDFKENNISMTNNNFVCANNSNDSGDEFHDVQQVKPSYLIKISC